MKKIKFVLYLSVAVLIAGGIFFVKANRHEMTVKIIEDLSTKTIVFYSSNFNRMYINSQKSHIGDMDKLCIEGADYFQKAGLKSLYFKVEDGSFDPYTLSSMSLDKILKKDLKYILIDVMRDTSKHGTKQKAGDKVCAPISIVLCKKSKSYENSLLFAGRIKDIIDRKYKDMSVKIITVDTPEYNQSKGYIGMLLALGDASNTFDEARESLKIFCDAVKEIIDIKQ